MGESQSTAERLSAIAGWLFFWRNRPNRDAEALAASREELQKLNATLEQRVAERTATLLEQTSLVSSIFQSTPDGMMTVTNDGIITSWNPGAERLFGYSAGEIIGNSADALVPPGEQWLTGRGAEGGNRRATQTAETTRLRKDGTAIELVVTTGAIRSSENQVTGFAVLYHDNTRTKRIQAERRARDLAVEQARLRLEFLARMSHEVRTPLNSIIGQTELLMLSGLSSSQREQADKIASSGELLLTIVNDILEFSKLDAGKVVLEKVSFALDHLMEETIHDFVAPAALKGIDLALFVDPGITEGLRGDPNRLRQILNNLLSNAVKFTAHGEVSLSVAKLQEIDNDLLLSFEVRDSGIGIPREIQGRLFQPFVQADGSTARDYGGTGLGLAITADLVKQMGGEIGFESESGRGSTFHCTARFERDPARVGMSELRLGRDGFAGMRALVVTPSATNRRMLSEYLSRWGISNISMNTTASALKELRAAARKRNPFHLALVETTLPGVGDSTLIEEIKRDEALADIKVLAISPLDPAGTEPAASGADATISKPIRPSRLFNCLMALLQGNRPSPLNARVQGKPPIIEDDKLAARKFVSILVVDDNPVNSSLARSQLERLGYWAELTDDGYRALEALARRQYKIILMDCEMPRMDGYTTTAEIRRQEHPGRHTTIIAMTAHAMAGMRARCLAVGLDDFLAKPVKLKALAAMLDRWAFGESAGHNSAVLAAPPGEAHDGHPAEEFDLSTIKELCALSSEASEEVFLNLVEIFRAELSSKVAALRSAIANRDAGAIRQLAHALKGSSLTLGAARFGALCEDVQKSAEGAPIEETIIRATSLIAQAAGLPELLKRAAAAAMA